MNSCLGIGLWSSIKLKCSLSIDIIKVSGILVNNETTSNETKTKPSGSLKLLISSENWNVSLILNLLNELKTLLSMLATYLAKGCIGDPTHERIGLRGMLSLWILDKP